MACAASAAPTSERACSCGKKACKVGLQDKKKTLKVLFWMDPLASIGIYFLCCNTTCRPSPGLGTAEARQPYSPRGQAQALRVHGRLSDCCGGFG